MKLAGTSRLRSLDWSLLATVSLLVAFGLATLYSLSVPREDLWHSFFARQMTAALVGGVLLFLLARVNFRRVRAYAPILVPFAIALLLGVLLFGARIGGTKGWYAFGGFSFQPVEFAKLVFAIALARYLADHHDDRPIGRLVGSAALLAAFAIPVLLQPDVGSALLFIAVWVGCIAVADLPPRLLAKVGAVLAVLVVAAWFVLPSVQHERIVTFLQPTRDPLGSGYNVRQSIVAIGSGQVTGRGLGLGPQSQLNFLPAAETDFIFAVIGEELGFVGAGLVLLLFGFLLLRILRSVRTTSDRFARYATASILALLTVQVLVNIGMNLGLAPVTGVPLPFVSYGGSALIASLAAIGFLEAVAVRSREVPTV